MTTATLFPDETAAATVKDEPRVAVWVVVESIPGRPVPAMAWAVFDGLSALPLFEALADADAFAAQCEAAHPGREFGVQCLTATFTEGHNE